MVFYSPGPTDENCDYIVAADVNADGYVDLLVLDAETKNISVLLNNGDGTFKAAALYSTSATSPPQSFAMGDFNGDGFLDIAVPDLDEERVAIMLGGPNGTFGSGQLITCCFTPEWIGAGDFNGDGILDLVVIENFLNRVEVLLGAGDGTFPTQINTNTPEGLYKLLIADFDGDGKLDIAGITNNEDVLQPSVSVLLGNGDGTFQQPVEYPVGNTPNGLALGDIDGDGKLDILAGNSQDSTTSLLLGNGDGTFQAQRIILPQLSGSFGIATADFNGDGRPDVANLAGASVQTIPFGLSHASLLFPVQMVGTTSTSQSVTVTNTTNSAVSIIDIGVLGAKPFDFPETNDCPASLGAGAQCTITVSFKPTAKNDCSAYVTIYFGTGPNTETIALDGTGTVVSLSATQLNFGAQTVGTRSAPMSFTLTNKGAHALTVSGIVIAGTNIGDFAESNNCGSSVASGGACTITSFFAPKVVGHRSAYIRIEDNGGGSPQKVTLSGIGQ